MKKLAIKLLLLFCGLLFLPGNLLAQFTVSGEFRPRLEYRDGYAKLRDSSMTAYPVILGRNRLIFDYKNEQFMAKFSLQHAYVFGENNYGSDTITRNTVNIFEGWFKYNFTKVFAVKIGRMELVYDDARLFGNSNWSPKGATHDVALLQWEAARAGYRGDFGFAINNTAPASNFLSSYLLKNYKYMGYVYEQKKFFKEKFVVSLLGIMDVFQKPSKVTQVKTTHNETLYVINSNHDTIGTTTVTTTSTGSVTTTYPGQLYARLTAGGTAAFTWKNLKVFASGYYQGGHFSDGKTINAGFFSGFASYRVVKPLTLLAGCEFLSGNDYSNTTALKTKSTSFSTLYGTSHGFYGYMDMFSTHVTSGSSAGLTDLYARATLMINEKISLEATWRMMGLAKGYLQVTPKKAGDLPYEAVNKKLGSEADMMFVYKPFTNFEVNAAYCFFMPTSTMEKLNSLKQGTSKWAQYAYIMLTYKPSFFNSDKH
ncbi:MAG: alginate export family protein [Bacteroidota bacterium]